MLASSAIRAARSARARSDVADLLRVVVLYIATRLALALFVWLTSHHFDCHGHRCLRREFFPGNVLLNGLFQWDGHHYVQLVQRGYYIEGTDTTAPFFPMFPLAAWLIGKLVGSPLAGGIVVNHLASIAGAYLITRLARRLKVGESDASDEAIAREASLFWLASPLTFFYCVYLSESLFAFASVLMLWSVARGSWPVALLAGILVTATRNAGMIVVASALVLAWERRELISVGARGWVCLALAPLGLFALMAWQHHKLGNAMAWSETQVFWTRWLTLPWKTIAYDWQGLPGLQGGDVDQMYRTQEVLALCLTAPLFLLRRRLNLPWALLLLGIAEWTLPLATNSLLSASRYQAGNLYFALAIPALLAPRPTLRGLCWMLFGMVLAWYASTFPLGVWAT
jgi:hypothetical protein